MKISIMQSRARDGQLTWTSSLQSLDATAGRAAAEQADILVTPEMFLTGYNIGAPAVRASAQPPDGELLQSVAQLARKHQIAILAGYPEIAPNGAVYNSAVFVDADGTTLSNYRKTHLFGSVDRAQFTAGASLNAPFIYRGWQIAIAICYDIEFPEVARFYRQAGAEVILTPTANMAPFFSVASHMVPVRAQENAVYIAYANYVGCEGEFNYCGLSCLCGPLGEEIARASEDTEELISGSISRSDLQEARKATTYLEDLRAELYTLGENRGA